MAKSKDGETKSYQEDQPTEFRGGPKMGVALITGRTFTNKSVTYYEIEGMAMVEGDIALGEVENVKAQTEAAEQMVALQPTIAMGVGITGSQFRWPNCRIPYEIDPALPNPQRVTEAIAHWEAVTAFRFPLRTAANASQHPNYVRFTDAGGCWSRLGMQGNQQTISLGPGCSKGNAIHEIGHTVGLWHEQSREDRDLFVKIRWENIQSGMSAQFNQHITDGDDLGAYDYGSIMHYPRDAFSKNGQDTITPTNASAQIGQRTALSAGDLAAVKAMYPGCSVKPPLSDVGGTGGTVGVKKVIDDQRPFKKLIDDIRKQPWQEPIKRLRDPVKQISDPIGFPGGGVINPGILPFTMATPHHARLIGGAGDEGAAEYARDAHQQLLDLEAAIAEARARAAQANADAARLEQVSDALAAALDQGGGGS